MINRPDHRVNRKGQCHSSPNLCRHNHKEICYQHEFPIEKRRKNAHADTHTYSFSFQIRLDSQRIPKTTGRPTKLQMPLHRDQGFSGCNSKLIRTNFKKTSGTGKIS